MSSWLPSLSDLTHSLQSLNHELRVQRKVAFHQSEIDVGQYTENTLGRFEHLVLINIRNQIKCDFEVY